MSAFDSTVTLWVVWTGDYYRDTISVKQDLCSSSELWSAVHNTIRDAAESAYEFLVNKICPGVGIVLSGSSGLWPSHSWFDRLEQEPFSPTTLWHVYGIKVKAT
jgi:hypothetical protein